MPALPEDAYSTAHEAMACRFRLTLVHPVADYARQAAGAAFGELDQLEGRLSRFVESSDVFRINRLKAGARVRLHPDTFDCLQLAERIRCDTGGRFDVAYASSTNPRGPRFQLETQRLGLRALVPGLQVDLGGIGKGFALDRIAALLADWEIDTALLAAGSSTFLARGFPPREAGWTLYFGPDRQPWPLTLAGGAISASGASVRGGHIVDPCSGRSDSPHHRVWVQAPSAAMADALSTAFWLMPEPAVGEYCRRHPQVIAWLLDRPDGPLRRIAADGKAPVN